MKNTFLSAAIAATMLLPVSVNPSLAAEFLLNKNQTVIVSGEVTALKSSEIVVDNGMSFYTVDLTNVMKGHDATALLEKGMKLSVKGKLARFPDTRYIEADDVITLGPDMNEETAAAILHANIKPAAGDKN